MKREGELGRFTRHRRGRWLNTLVEQDHRRIKRRTRPMLGFKRFRTARRTLAGVEALAMLAKGQVRAVLGDDLPAQRAFVHQIEVAPDRRTVWRLG
jgi:transposase-like protein